MTTIPTLEADPCGRAEALRALRDKILTGQAVEETEFEAGNGQRRKVRYSKANLSALEREIEHASNACNLTRGVRSRRFVIGGRP